MSSNSVIIGGIQQVGIGVKDADAAFDWYRKHFSMDIPVFKSADVAELMLPYTGNMPQERYAILALNLAGGGGFEIWQYTKRTPVAPHFTIALGDLGIFAAKIKCRNVAEMYEYAKKNNLNIISELANNPLAEPHFFLKDPYGNIFEIVQDRVWFKTRKDLTGGIAGCIIGVSNMEASMKFYKDVLGYDTVVYDQKNIFSDFKGVEGAESTFRRVLLTHSKDRIGGFSKLLGPSHIELVQAEGKSVRKIYENRFWGDLGFIHLCFDINGMKNLENKCAELNYPFTVNSAESFDMGEAAGHFAYIEDPDGTLIEFVETHRVPIMKKIGFYLDLRKRDASKALPNWLISAFSFARVKK